MQIPGLVEIGELKNLEIQTLNDWYNFQKRNPKRTLGTLAARLLVSREQ